MQVRVPATIFMGMGVGKKTHGYGYGCSVNAKKSLLVYLTQAHWHLWQQPILNSLLEYQMYSGISW